MEENASFHFRTGKLQSAFSCGKKHTVFKNIKNKQPYIHVFYILNDMK